MVPDGAATVQYMRDTYPNITVDEGGDIFTCLNKLIRGCHNFIVYHDIGLFGAIKEKALQDPITILPIVLDEYPHYVAVRRSLASDMIQQLKTALIELRTNRRLETIRARYMDSGGTMEIRMSAGCVLILCIVMGLPCMAHHDSMRTQRPLPKGILIFESSSLRSLGR